MFSNWNDENLLEVVELLAHSNRWIASEEELSDLFDQDIAPMVIEQYGEDDTIAMSEAFNNWSDRLCKDGEIHPEQYANLLLCRQVQRGVNEMKTFDEIAKCPKAHYEFFTDRALLNLLEYLECLRVYGKDNGNTKLAKSGFRSNMRSRREEEYLDKPEEVL